MIQYNYALLNLPMAKATGFLCTKGFLVHLRVELTLVPQDFHGQTPYWCLSPCTPGSRRWIFLLYKSSIPSLTTSKQSVHPMSKDGLRPAWAFSDCTCKIPCRVAGEAIKQSRLDILSFLTPPQAVLHFRDWRTPRLARGRVFRQTIFVPCLLPV